jgi:hypothetical protein
MPDENPIRLDQVEREVLYLLTGLRGEQPIWSIGDLEREVGSEADEAVRGLRHTGLIYDIGGFVFASRAGAHMVQLVGHVV